MIIANPEIRLRQWHSHFALLPVPVENYTATAWLCMVERKQVYAPKGQNVFVYRLPGGKYDGRHA